MAVSGDNTSSRLNAAVAAYQGVIRAEARLQRAEEALERFILLLWDEEIPQYVKMTSGDPDGRE